MHNFSVTDDHTYFVSDLAVWVHNQSYGAGDVQAKADEIQNELNRSNSRPNNKSKSKYLEKLGKEMHDKQHSDPKFFTDILDELTPGERRTVLAAVSVTASIEHDNQLNGSNAHTNRVKNSARNNIRDALNNSKTSDVAFDVLSDFISSEGARQYNFSIEADSMEQALQGGKSGDTKVFRELFNSLESKYARFIFSTAPEGHLARDGGSFIANGSDYTEHTGGKKGEKFNAEGFVGQFDGSGIGDVVGSMTTGVEVRARNGNLIIKGRNSTNLDSYDFGRLKAKFGIRSNIIDPPAGAPFSPVEQVFTITIPNPYLPPPPPKKVSKP